MLDAISSRTPELHAWSSASLFQAESAAPRPSASDRISVSGGVRDAYDMQLYREPDGSFAFELDMKIEFDFTHGPAGQQWTARRSGSSSMAARRRSKPPGTAIRSPTTTASRSGSTSTPTWPLDASENRSIAVVKIDTGGFNRSYAVPGQNTGRFDSEATTAAEKSDTFLAIHQQAGAPPRMVNVAKRDGGGRRSRSAISRRVHVHPWRVSW